MSSGQQSRLLRLEFVIAVAVLGLALTTSGFETSTLGEARQAFEGQIEKAREQFDVERAKAAGKYRATIQKARKKALEANDLDEALRLDESAKLLDGDVRTFWMETLRAQLDNTLWSDMDTRWGLRLDPGGEGGIYEQGKQDSPKVATTWEVIDVNSFVAGIHPRLSVGTLDPSRRKYVSWQRTSDRCFSVQCEFSGPATGSLMPLFRSSKARKAHAIYLKKLAELQRKRGRQVGKSERAYRKALEVAKKAAGAANDLEETLRLDRAIRMLGGSSLEMLEAQLLDSSWERTDEVPWTIRFERNRQCTYGPRQKSEWVPVDENTVRAGKHPYLWILTFDDDRKNARLIGSDKNQRYDLTLVRASQ